MRENIVIIWDRPGSSSYIRGSSMKPDLFILNLQCGEAGLQLLTPLEQLAFQGLLRTHHSHLCPQARRKVEIFMCAIKKKKLQRIQKWRTRRVPCLPYGTGNQSELGGKRHYCRSPSVSACLRWLPDSPWPPPASPGPSAWMSLRSVQQTSRSSGLAAGWHGSQGHSTVTHKHTNTKDKSSWRSMRR